MSAPFLSLKRTQTQHSRRRAEEKMVVRHRSNTNTIGAAAGTDEDVFVSFSDSCSHCESKKRKLLAPSVPRKKPLVLQDSDMVQTPSFATSANSKPSTFSAPHSTDVSDSCLVCGSKKRKLLAPSIPPKKQVLFPHFETPSSAMLANQKPFYLSTMPQTPSSAMLANWNPSNFSTMPQAPSSATLANWKVPYFSTMPQTPSCPTLANGKPWDFSTKTALPKTPHPQANNIKKTKTSSEVAVTLLPTPKKEKDKEEIPKMKRLEFGCCCGRTHHMSFLD